MPTTIVVALVGDPERPGAEVGRAERTRPWDERRRIELEVDDDESLASIGERAWAALGVAEAEFGQPAYVGGALALPAPDGTLREILGGALVGDDGAVVWNAYEPRLVTYAQVVRSVEAGAVEGDPHHVYLVLKEPIGDGLLIDWPTLLEALEIALTVAEGIATVTGAAEATRRVVGAVRERLRRGHAVAERHAPQWAQSGARPDQLAQFLRRDAWDPRVLASLLRLTGGEAEDLLSLFGFSLDHASGVWRRGRDDADRLLVDAYDEAAFSELHVVKDGGEVFRARIEELLETGRRPPDRRFDRPPEEDDEADEDDLDTAADAEEVHRILVVGSAEWAPCSLCGEEVGDPSDATAAFEARVNHALEDHGLALLQLHVVGASRRKGPPYDLVAVLGLVF